MMVQKDRSIFWKVIVSVIVRKKFIIYIIIIFIYCNRVVTRWQWLFYM